MLYKAESSAVTVKSSAITVKTHLYYLPSLTDNPSHTVANKYSQHAPIDILGS
jgi:hypothetical protein